MKIFTLLFAPLSSNSLRTAANKNSCIEKNTATSNSINKGLLLMPLMVLAFLFTNINAWGQNAGFFGTGGGLVTYELNGAAAANSYNWDANLGNTRSLVLKGGIIHTWKNGSGNVCGGNMYYRVYKQGTTPGSFSSAIALSFSSNVPFTTTSSPSNVSGSGSDQRWANSSQTINLRALATSEGTWVLEVYFDARMNIGSNADCNSTQFLNNGSSNYKLLFDVTRNPGFEASSTASPGWISDPSSAGSVANFISATRRSGSLALTSTVTTGSARTITRHVNNIVTIPGSGTNYIHAIGWVRAGSTDDQARVNAFSPDGGTAITGTLSNTTNGSWVRFSASGTATNGKIYVPEFGVDGDYSSGGGDSYFFDDMIIYTTALSSGADVTKPNAPTNLTVTRTGSGNNILSWTDGTDNATNTSGIEGTLILRTTTDKTAALSALNSALLDQAYYSTTSTLGPTTISDGTNTWTVVSNGTSSGTYTDVGATTNVTYVVVMRDKAYNYSAGVAAFSNCVNPTSGGTIGTAHSVCPNGDPNLLTSSAAASGNTGTLEYKWQRSTTSSSSGFSDIADSNSDTYNPPSGLTQTTWYKRLARVTCMQDWTGAAESDVIQVSINAVFTFANLQFPSSGSTTGSFSFYGRAYAAGVTEADVAGSGVEAQYGYSSSNTDPSGNDWTWANATFNSQQGNNDEFIGTLSGLAAGTYYYTFRYRLNGCAWQYGGFNGGFWNGTTNVNGTLTVTSSVPSILSSGGVVASSPGSGTSGYIGNTITINGANLDLVTIVKVGGSSGTTVTIASQTSSTITFAAINAGGQIYVESSSGNATSTESYTNLGYISNASADWNTASTWLGGALPPVNSTVTINHDVTINGAVSNAISSITVNSTKSLSFGSSGTITATTITNNGSLVMTSGGALTIAASGTFTNNSTFTRGTGTVSYAGAGILNGSSAITFNNLTINTGSLTLTTVPTIDGTLTINGGNLSSAPIYSSNSTLLYNITYNRFNEWNATGIGTIETTAGYPNNVTINSGTFTLLNSDAGTARAMNGSLTVASNATFATGTLNALLTIGGNIVNNGTITMSSNNSRIKCANFNNSSGANVTLSSVIGGDLEVTGDIIDNGTFNSNNRAIFFTGSAIQNINGSGVFNIDYVVSNKSGGQIQLQSNLLCEGPNAGNAMDLSSSSDILDLNGYTLTLGQANVSSRITGNGAIRGGGNSSLILLGDGNMGILNIDITTPGTTNVLNNLTLNRTNTGIVTLGNPLIINNALSLTSGTLNMQSNALSGTALTTSGTGKLQTQNTSPTPIPSGRSWSFEVEMNANSNQTVPQGNYATLRLNTGEIKTIADNSAIAGDFVVTSPATATVGTTIFFNGSTPQSIAGLAYNNIEFSGTGVKTFTSNASVGSTSAVTFTGTPGTIDFDGASNNLIFQLKSVDGGTARIGNTSGWTLTGNVTVERYIPVTANRRAWRLLTAPLKGTTNTSIFSNWQGVNNEGLLLFSPANYQGQAMTGYTTGGSMPNIWKYNSTNNTWEFIPNLTNENLFTDTINNGFLVFATGPSNSTNIVSGAATTTLKPQGQLITGYVEHSLTADKYHLIGNPYASPLNTVTMTQANPDTKVFMVDPSIGSVGGYVTYDGTNWAPSAPSASDAYIQSGQGFFVRSASATSFTISESHKVTGNSNTWFDRNATDTTSDKIRLLLYKQIDSQWQLADGILAVNSAAGNNDVDATDTGKMTNFNENIGFRNGTSTLAIEYRGLPTTGTVQPMRLTGTTVQPYQIRVKTENYSNSTLQPYLEDTQTGSLTVIPTDGSEVVVNFTGVASTTSNPDNRFRIVYPTTLSSDDPTALLVGVYPNPVEDKMFTVVLPEASVEASYTLTNLIGQQVQQGKLDAIQSSVSVSSLQGGIYLLQVLQSGKTFTTKLIIK